MSALVEHDDWPVHQPEATDAPIPGRHWYAGCEPGGDYDSETNSYHGQGPRVDPATGVCESCGETACSICGRENCPDHDETPELGEGRVWQHKRERWRRVTIRYSRRRLDGGRDVYVARNTSRRSQAIKESTLRKDYYPTTRETR